MAKHELSGLLQPPKKPHPSITFEVIERAISDDNNLGYCVVCGHEHDGLEPDARNVECQNCSVLQVYGAAEILIMYENELA